MQYFRFGYLSLFSWRIFTSNIDWQKIWFIYSISYIFYIMLHTTMESISDKEADIKQKIAMYLDKESESQKWKFWSIIDIIKWGFWSDQYILREAKKECVNVLEIAKNIQEEKDIIIASKKEELEDILNALQKVERVKYEDVMEKVVEDAIDEALRAIMESTGSAIETNINTTIKNIDWIWAKILGLENGIKVFEEYIHDGEYDEEERWELLKNFRNKKWELLDVIHGYIRTNIDIKKTKELIERFVSGNIYITVEIQKMENK